MVGNEVITNVEIDLTKVEVIDIPKPKQTKNVVPTTEKQNVLPDEGKELAEVIVEGVTAEIDKSIKSENIKLGVNILGVEGNVAPDKPDQEKTVYPQEHEQVVEADPGYELSRAIVKPIETEIKTIVPSIETQVVKPAEGKYLKEVTVEAIEDIEPEIAAQEEKLASLGVKVDDLPVDKPEQDKVVTPSDEQQTIVADEGYKLGSVIVEPQEDLSEELNEQDEELSGLEADVEALEDKPQSDIQYMIDATNSCRYLFSEYSGESLPFVKNLDTSNVANMYCMFYYCRNLTSLDVSNFDTSNVSNMSSMFNSCEKITSLDVSKFNMAKVTTINNMFYNCKALTTLVLFNSVGNVSDMGGFLGNCEKLSSLDLSNFNTENATVMSSMFYNCKLLTSLDVSNFDTSNVTTMQGMFYGCSMVEHLDVSQFNTEKVTTMQEMFRGCEKITSLDLSNFDTTNVKTAYGMFNGCKALTSLDLSSFDTSKITNMNSMFNECQALETIINLDIRTITTMGNAFIKCYALKNLTLKNIKTAIQLGSGTTYGTLLTNESLINTFKELWDLTGSTSQKLTLSTDSKTNIANIYVKLVDVTDEMLAQDQYAGNKKPCVVCESTDDGAMTLTEYATSKNWAIA